VTNERGHTNRVRAESFGALAEAYDAARPGYPQPLIDDLVALHPADVLDIGCGTGKAARMLAARGLPVLGVEVDPQMADVARRHGIYVELGAFETWDAAARRFDLITCAQAWHWIDGAAGARKAAALLRPGGTLALFWNFARFDHASQYALDRAYESAAPELSRKSVVRGGGPATVPEHLRELAEVFAKVSQVNYDWIQAYSREQWLALVRTHSDHSTLPPERLDRLTRALGAEIDSLGGTLVVRYRTEAVFASLNVLGRS
jgi:SAM-dependent methyltransferase